MTPPLYSFTPEQIIRAIAIDTLGTVSEEKIKALIEKYGVAIESVERRHG